MAKTCLRRGIKIFAARPQTGKSQKSRLFYFGNFPGTSRAITLMNLVPANQFGSHFLNHKNRNWKHMHQTKWYKLQNILCQKLRTFLFSEKYDKKLKANGPSLLSGVHVTSLTEPQNGFMEFQQICSYYQDLNIHNAGRMFTLYKMYICQK